MKYKTLLFDVDDTLLDFRTTEKRALYTLFSEEQLELTKEIEQTYQAINHQLWQDFEHGKVAKETISETRFGLLFEQLGKKVDGKALGARYQKHLSDGHDLLGNSKKILEKLQPDYDLYVVTNGIAVTQYKRLKDADLYPLFQDIFVSEEIGYQKPMKEYFDYVFDQIPDFDKEKTVIIGDSLNSDIGGGQQANIQTVWLNPTRQAGKQEIQPTYEIQQLDQLFSILG
ncbi:noncanonical pyrimidine nucleotidase, YjjG family [Enterococcus sp. BWB1-3]|uniref:YjjG family noncanonical pyrimidine nucleotidase n=1 Tax=unclassified Enterococcus TaxID=2608891 RepID=UPI001924CCBF|nr:MULTISPECIES: YjjG family noncanonical pyrimidine nucleotidase [unclassified Enterococcus]MBL1227672.1 noncanonical pyrimidine nucleotidase, YjjG family [Enterococcus sp. BWB1-3]MCB5952141.1 YjjG family noncanonical pyrimidine nucleotidase [Enterococcus sp. BWT-B8]